MKLKRFLSVLSVVLCLTLVLGSTATAAPALAAETGITSSSAAETVVKVVSTIAELAKPVVSDMAATARNYAQNFRVDFAGADNVNLLSPMGILRTLVSIDSLNGLLSVVSVYLNAVMETLLQAIVDLLPYRSDLQDVTAYESENFLPGHTTFVDEAADNAVWSMGYDRQLLTPQDFLEKVYYKGGSGGSEGLGQQFEGKHDDLYVRTVCMDDGRGPVAFAVIDTVGISNADVRAIRAAVAEYAGADFVSINVSSTHTHSGLDTQGVWAWVGQIKDQPLETFSSMILNGGGSVSGVDKEYMDFLVAQVAKSILNAYENMAPGELYFAQKSTADENGDSIYFRTRNNPVNIINEVYRLRFEPTGEGEPIIMTNFGVHPEGIGVIDEPMLSADFIPYMEEVLNDAGYQFLFLQGAIGEMVTESRGASNDGITESRIDEVRRYGQELGYFTLGMTLTQAECEAQVVNWVRENEGQQKAAAKDAEYSLWFADWQAVKEDAVEPILNVAHKEILLYSTNPIVKLLGKFSAMTNHLLLDKTRTREIVVVSEVGYLEIGKNVKVFLCPGETSPDLMQGGYSMDAKTAMYREDFVYDPLMDYMQEGDTLLVFDLMNDAAGYIQPDSDYGLVVLKYLEGGLVAHTTALFYSFGKTAASTFIGGFLELYQTK